MKKEHNLVQVKSVDQTIQSWANRSYIGETLRENILRANALIVPGENYAGSDMIFFPEGTEDLIRFVERRRPADLILGLNIQDSDYKELSRYADVLFIASFIVTSFIAPIIVNLVSDYIKDRSRGREREATVKWSLTVQDGKTQKSLQFTYDGPASLMKDQIQRALAAATPPDSTDIDKDPEL